MLSGIHSLTIGYEYSECRAYANEYVIAVYLDQLTLSGGKSSPCHPAYQADITMSSLALETLPPEVADDEVVLPPLVLALEAPATEGGLATEDEGEVMEQ